VDHHLRLCSSCAAYAESYRCTVRLSRHLPRLPLPLELQQRLQAILEETGKEKGGPADGSESTH